MRDFDWGLVPENGLVLLTIEDIDQDLPVKIADFRDTHALAFSRSGGFIGQSRTNGMRLGKKPRMIDGVWYMEVDEKGSLGHQDVQLTPELVTLKPLP